MFKPCIPHHAVWVFKQAAAASNSKIIKERVEEILAHLRGDVFITETTFEYVWERVCDTKSPWTKDSVLTVVAFVNSFARVCYG